MRMVYNEAEARAVDRHTIKRIKQTLQQGGEGVGREMDENNQGF